MFSTRTSGTQSDSSLLIVTLAAGNRGCLQLPVSGYLHEESRLLHYTHVITSCPARPGLTLEVFWHHQVFYQAATEQITEVYLILNRFLETVFRRTCVVTCSAFAALSSSFSWVISASISDRAAWSFASSSSPPPPPPPWNRKFNSYCKRMGLKRLHQNKGLQAGGGASKNCCKLLTIPLTQQPFDNNTK